MHHCARARVHVQHEEHAYVYKNITRIHFPPQTNSHTNFVSVISKLYLINLVTSMLQSSFSKFSINRGY